MGKRHRGRWVIPACGLMILGAVACSGERRDRSTSETGTPPASNERREAQRPSMTLVGCLQQGDGRNDFILTADNTAHDITGTTGSSSSAEKQRLDAARKSYRLTDADQDMTQYVGKQVRVTGNLVEASDIPPSGTAGQEHEKSDEPRIRERDLAKVDVGTIEMVAETCGPGNRANAHQGHQ